MKHRKNSKNDSDFFDEDAYKFIHSISTPQKQKKRVKGKLTTGIIFLLALMTALAAAEKIQLNSELKSSTHDKPTSVHTASSNDHPTQKILTEEEITQTLTENSQTDSRYAQILDKRNELPDDMLQAVCRNEEIVDFAVGYLTVEKTTYGELDEDDLTGGIPLLLQWDSRWGYAPYGDNVIGLSGCGPTCLSMAAVYLTGNLKYSPDYIADYAAKNGYYEQRTGTSWSLFTKGCREFDIQSREIPLSEKALKNSLDEGKPVICSLREGDFTAVGHFIVITGYDDSGKFIINDPNSTIRSKKHWSFEELSWQIRNLWEFYT